MEAVEFIRTIQKMCKGTDCDVCPLDEKNGCDVCCAEDPVGSVRIVEEWAAEQERQKAEQERQKAEQERQKAEQERQKAEQDDIEGSIYREIIFHKTRIENLEYDVSAIWHNVSAIWHNLEELAYQIHALREKVDHATTTEQSQTPEPKRTNKDVLLAAFPRMVMDGDVPVLCPRTMDRDIHIQHCDVRSCDQCRHEYWLSEVEK